jgi:hypothetical protein
VRVASLQRFLVLAFQVAVTSSCIAQVGTAKDESVPHLYSPVYDWSLKLSSPDGQYDAVIIRGNPAAFADFFYNVYIFPHADVPKDQKKGDPVTMAGAWQGSKFLVYSGSGSPMIRWTNSRVLEIDVDDLYPAVASFYPVKRFSDRDWVLTSLVFDKTDPRNARP